MRVCVTGNRALQLGGDAMMLYYLGVVITNGSHVVVCVCVCVCVCACDW